MITHPNLVKFRGNVFPNGAVRASVSVQDKFTRPDLTSFAPDVLCCRGQTMKFATLNFRWSYGVVDKSD